jgi:hypothetical protein
LINITVLALHREGHFLLVFFLEEPWMNTSILTIVLASTVLAGQSAAPAWQTNYSQAQEKAAAQQKPLAVFFGSGANGWVKAVSDGSPAAEVKNVLADKYICVYADTATPAGKKLAQDFAITANSGVVIGDRTGSFQSFWHQGSLSNQNLTRYLQKYADPSVVVRTTETAGSSRTSFYPPSSSEGNWGSSPFEPSYCPSCSNARSRR